MLGIKDDYIAFCLDEAGAFLLAQPDPPNFKRRQPRTPANRDKQQLMLLRQLGADVQL